MYNSLQYKYSYTIETGAIYKGSLYIYESALYKLLATSTTVYKTLLFTHWHMAGMNEFLKWLLWNCGRLKVLLLLKLYEPWWQGEVGGRDYWEKSLWIYINF